MKPGESVADRPTGRNAGLVADLVGNLVRVCVMDAIPVLVAQLVPALVQSLAHSFQDKRPDLGGVKYATVKQAAAMMSCHPATVRRLVREGRLGRYLLGDDVRILVSDIHAYMARAGAASPSIDLAERALAVMGVRGNKGGPDHG